MQQRGYGALCSRAQPVLHAGSWLPAPEKLLHGIQLGMPLQTFFLRLQLVEDVLANRLQMPFFSLPFMTCVSSHANKHILLQRRIPPQGCYLHTQHRLSRSREDIQWEAAWQYMLTPLLTM